MDGMPKKPCGRKQHAPTDAQRKLVELHATVGTTQDMIARVIGIDKKTLRLHYRDELDLSMAKANATIGGALFNKAKGGDTVMDLFGGSGSTLIACEKTARDCRMMELDPKYCDVIIQRWQKFTGQTATLEATGQPFRA